MTFRLALIAALGLALAACGNNTSQAGDFKPVPVTPVIGDVVMGSETAPVSMVEYASLECPHCRDFWKQEFPRLKAAYIDTGKVKYVFRDLPVHEDGFEILLASIARCKGKEVYYDMIEEIFSNQIEIMTAAQKKQAGPILAEIGARHGLSKDEMRTCMDFTPALKSSIEKSQADAFGKNIRSTPTIFINDELQPVHDFASLSAVIDARLAGKATPASVTNAPASPTSTAPTPAPATPAPATPPAKPPA